jgi:hypothetical protein
VIPQLVDGGGWKTTFFLVNDDNTSHQYSISFYAESGSALALPLANGSLSSDLTGVVAANGLEIIETAGSPSGSVAVGWAFINADSHVTGFAVFRQQVPGRPDFEATVPFEAQLYQVMNVPFDNINGFATGVALVNDGTSAASIQATVFDASGQTIAVEPQLSIPVGGHTSFNLATQFSATAGISGIVQFSASGPVVAGLGLRFNSQGAFTSFPVSGK